MYALRQLVLGAALSLAAAQPAAALDGELGGAAEFVQSFGNDAIAALTGEDLTDAELEARFRELFVIGFDVPAIARRALGRYWSRATAEERREYVRLFEDLIVHTYAARFRHYSGEQFVVHGLRPGPAGSTIVESRVISPKGDPPVRVDWLVTQDDARYKIQDVIIEGVSMVITQRSEFASVIRQRGGKVAGLIKALREKTAKLRTSANKG